MLERLLILLGAAPSGKRTEVKRAKRRQVAHGPATGKRPARPRDFQRRRVYDWEEAVLAPTKGGRLSLAACERQIEAAFRWHERPDPGDRDWRPPVLGDGRGRRHACGSRAVIKLPRWARTRVIVLHECAHGMSTDGHGPQFVRAYLRLLHHFLGHDTTELEASLRRHGVMVAPDTGESRG